MTNSEQDAVLDEVAAIRELIRNSGLRCTSARLAVMQRLRQAESPVTHAELAEELVPLGFDKATVFRNLSDLTDADLVTRTELGDHVWRFEIRDPDDPHEGKHPHFVCVDCGQVTCFSDVVFDKSTQKRANRIGRVTEILLKGHCRECGSA
ncbi:Fur family transcriptional regulator [Thalassoroseus pseudoceratinae]|uniref:Fur family transcriptional regulator n=1 Tax=Thalassoroseus pseudoceratinae TaxID=2713176 RepID=UPI00141ECA60|nr:transcriptional repressor [Thalassoroseus pseudoceratinae]